MYYSMSTDGDENTYMEKETGLNSHIALYMGRLWDDKKDNISLPYRFTLSVDSDETPNLYAWYPGSCLMQQKLIDLLKSLGIDNLQIFPAEIKHEDTDESVPGYAVVNIVGAVACADMSKSDASPLATAHYFNKLVIDPVATGGLLMFRVEESPMRVLVHEKVAKAVQASGFVGLTFEAIDESPNS